MYWTPTEKKLLKSLNTPEKIQNYVDGLIYNPSDSAYSPRLVMITGEGHCLEGGMLAAAALEFHGYPPLMVDLQAHRDDHHVLTVYRTKTGWGSISKSNTTLLRGRNPLYRSIHELVMSYFDFYFNVDRQLSLYAYSHPINLNRYNKWHWRTSEKDLVELGRSFNDFRHYECASIKQLEKMPRVSEKLRDACFLGADPEGLYKVE